MTSSKFPIIKTNNLILGSLRYTDIPKITEYAGNRKIADVTLNIPHPYREKDAVFWINAAYQGFSEGSQVTFRIGLKDTEEFIGGIGLKIAGPFDRAELGYWIAEPFWNRGFASEAACAVLNYGFKEKNLHKIYATHLIENPASGRVMIKNGMIREGELVDHVKKGERYMTLVQYRLTASEHQKLNKNEP